MGKADIVSPTFDNVVKNYYDRLETFQSKLGKADDSELLQELESLNKTREHLADFGLKVKSPLPESKGKPS